VSAGHCGIHANAVDLTSGAIAGGALGVPDGELSSQSDLAITD